MMPLSQLVVVAFLVLTCLPLYGQQANPQYDVGLTSYGSFDGGDMDAINMLNGNVYLRIPLFGYPQRGSKLTLGYSFQSNGKTFTQEAVCNDPSDPTDCYNVLAVSSNPSSGSTIVDNQQIYDRGLHYSAIRNGTHSTYNFYPMEIITPDGSAHHGGQLSGSGLQVALDGSGVASLFHNNSFTTGGVGVLDRNGVLYGTGNGNVIREDPDGNTITSTSSGIQDTIGRIIPPRTSTTDTSGCTGPNAVSSASVWTVPAFGGRTATYKFCYTTVAAYIPSSKCTDVQSDLNYTLTVLQSIVLPNATTWTFSYQSRSPNDPPNVNFGELSQVLFPTGGTISYQYEMSVAPNTSMCSSWVTSRTVDAHDGTGSHATTYQWSQDTNRGIPSVQNSVIDPAGNKITRTFNGASEITAQYYNASGSLLKQVDTTYIPAVAALNGYEWNSDLGFSTINNFPQTITTTLNNSVSRKTYSYCCSYSFSDYFLDNGVATPTSATASYGLVSDIQEYDYGNGSAGPLLRETATNYLWSLDPTYQAANLLETPSSITIFDGNGSQAASTSYTYDEPSYLAASNITTQHLPSLDGSARGHSTTLTRWLNGGTSPISHTSWYDTGVPNQLTDFLGHSTTYAYSADYSGSLATSITNALGHTALATYDFNSGLKTIGTDPNSNTVSWNYDIMGRLLSETRPDFAPGTNIHSMTSVCYGDLAGQCAGLVPVNSILVNNTIGATASFQRETDFDGFGRSVLTKIMSDPSGITYGRTSYDVLGRPYQIWNSTRCNPTTQSTCSSESTWGITSRYYDALGRQNSQTQPDEIGLLIWTYNGNAVIHTDEAANSWTNTFDALGRLSQVVEPGSRITNYGNDSLGNFVSAIQHGGVGEATRTRQFGYDSLSRLITSTNPETGMICFGIWNGTRCVNGYDRNGNLIAKTDARSVTVNYSYDALNRLLSKTYPAGTPSSCYQYDQSSAVSSGGNLIGRLTNSWTQIGACPAVLPGNNVTLTRRSILGYDAMGRVLSEQQCTLENCVAGSSYVPSYTYDLLGNVVTQSSGLSNGPGAFTFTNVYNTASRLSSIMSSNARYPSSLFSLPSVAPSSGCGAGLTGSPPGYSPAGGLLNALYGSSLQLSRSYDSRLRITCETDTGNMLQSPTPSSATITILGAAQNH